MYKSEFYPTPKMAEDFYSDRKITAKEISSKMAYTNKKYAEMVNKSRKGSVTNYGVYKNYVMQAELLSLRLEKQGYRGIVKNINRKTGEVEFYSGGYGQYTQEQRRQILGIRDAIQSNWAMHSDANGQNPLLMEELAEQSKNTLSQFLNGTNIQVEDYENIESFFDTPEWQSIRRKVKYDNIIDMNDLLTNAKQAIDYDVEHGDYNADRFMDILRNSNDVIDFNYRLNQYVNSLI